MAKRTNDLFFLIKSLTHSEHNALFEESWKSRHSNFTSKNLPNYIRFAQFLKTQTRYNDQEAKVYMGYNKFAPPVWRALKRDTLNRVLAAIDYANGSKTGRAKVQKAPEQIRQLIEKRIWTRADKVAKKHVEIASRIEQFENLLQLLQLRSQIVTHSYPGNEVEKQLEAIHFTRKLARDKHANIEQLQDIYFELRSIARSDKARREEGINRILQSPPIGNKDVKGIRAEMYYWLIRRVGNRILKNTPGYLEAIDGGVLFYEENEKFWGDFEFRSFGVQFLSDLAVFSSMAHAFEKAEIAIRKLEVIRNLKKVSPLEDIELQGRVFMLQMFFSQYSRNREKMEQLAKDFLLWHKEKPDIISEDLRLRIYHIASLNAFYLGNYSDCIRLSHVLRTKSPSVFRPQITSFGWVFYIIVRLVQKEYDLIKVELTAIKRYLFQFDSNNKVYQLIFDLGKKLTSKNPSPAPRVLVRGTGEKVRELVAAPSHKRLEALFPFAAWCDCLNSDKCWDNLLEVATAPVISL
ncbi:MAG TPA: hypothetical protein ENJ82_12900 [Bacteroidetes bacterium]|nr:hypothetical protein [Bacteroidota bacterium]